MKVSEILQKALERISKPRAWIKGDFARSDYRKAGACVYVDGPAATCWCAVGAVQAVQPPGNDRDRAVGTLNRVAPGKDIIEYNDNPKTKKVEVLEVFNKAIRRARRLEARGEL